MAGQYDDALDALKNCSRDIDLSRTDAATALDKTRDAQQQAAQSGFLGVARHLDRPIRTLEAHLSHLATAAATIDRAATQLIAITKDLTPTEVVDRLTASRHTLEEASDQSSNAIISCTDASDQVLAALQGGQPHRIAGILESERRTLSTTIKTLIRTAALTDQAITTAQRIGDS